MICGGKKRGGGLQTPAGVRSAATLVGSVIVMILRVRIVIRYDNAYDNAADAWYAQLPLDPYAATDEAEFFAVAAEAFFVSPISFQRSYPNLYKCFSAYFRQDPVARMS